MLRLISEMAVAMSVWSDSEKPARAAASRPCCLAVTTSASRDTGTRTTSSAMGRARRSKSRSASRAHVVH